MLLELIIKTPKNRIITAIVINFVIDSSSIKTANIGTNAAPNPLVTG